MKSSIFSHKNSHFLGEMSMFYEKLQSLCAKNGVSVTKMCQEIGLATSAPVRWKRGSVPNMTTLFKIAEYFGIEPEYFLADNYTSYVEWLAEKKHMSVAQVISPKWMEEETQPVEPDPYGVLLPLLKQLTPAQVQRVKDFISGLLS